MSEQESVVTETGQPTPGQLLREARQAKGLSLEQVANKINLRAHNIEAIENDEDDSNLSTTFTKGYLKLYAKFVDVSEPDVLQAYERINSVAKEPAKLQSFSRRVARQTSDARLMMLTYFIIAIVIALSVLWWFQQSKETPVVQAPINAPSIPIVEQESTGLVDSQPTQVNQSPLTSDGSLDNNVVATSDNNPIASTDEAEPDADSVEALVGEAIDGLTSEQPLAREVDEDLGDAIPASDELLTEAVESEEGTAFDSFAAPTELIFEFADDCWVSVVDSTGETRAIGVKRAGYIMTVPGVPPFEVTLGAPQVVQISFAGEDVDMSSFPAGRTARFELPLQD